MNNEKQEKEAKIAEVKQLIENRNLPTLSEDFYNKTSYDELCHIAENLKADLEYYNGKN